MGDAQQIPSGGTATATPIGTSPSGSMGMVLLAGLAWVAWIGFLVFILVTRS